MTGSTGIAPEDTPDHLLATGNQNEIEDGALMKILRHSITILYFKEFKKKNVCRSNNYDRSKKLCAREKSSHRY